MTLLASAAWAEDSHYLIQVEGLNCPFCAYGIEKQLEKLDGVEDAETELALGQVAVQVTEGTTLSEDTVREIIRDAGFTFKRMVRHEGPASLRGDNQ
tara:strand:+ start:863 stop:1153 length:291 start_codon:yes stop_codon:yes gene_type:complete